jgi:dipeptidyl aminopeptidase/acylaminoacyl peptidase
MMRTFRFALVLCGLYAAPFCAAAATAAPTFQLSDLRRLVHPSEPAISSDGKRVAVVVSTAGSEGDEPPQELDLIDIATGARRALIDGRKQLSMPRWSPDSSRIAFLAEDAQTKQTQVFVIAASGGEATRVTAAAMGVDSWRFSPDGTRIAYIAEDDAPDPDEEKKRGEPFRVTDNDFLVRSRRTPWHLWIVPSTGGPARRLTQGDDFSLSTDHQDSAPEPEWSRDGKRIVFTRFPNPYWAQSYKSTIASVGIDDGKLDAIISDEGVSDPGYAPNGSTLAFVRPRNGDPDNGNAVYVSMAGKTRDATQSLARHVDDFAWLPRSDALLLAVPDGTQRSLWLQPLSGSARKLDLGEVQAHAPLTVSNNGTVVFIGSTTAHPDELYVLDTFKSKPRRLTHLNAFVDGLVLGRTASVQWQGPDGLREDGVLTYPANYVAGKKYPLVLNVHGGPADASTLGFSALPQLLAAQGFAVFEPNYRGSNNLGDAYQHAIVRDTVAGPGKDILAGLATVEKLGLVDETRIGIGGWSYGGTMTTWLTTQSSIWKAAVAGAALNDWVMDYTISYYGEGDTHYFGGSPWTSDTYDIWREQSPIAHVRNVRTPTLILGNVGDPDVPIVNSYEWYHALRDNGVPVEFYAYPVDSHMPRGIAQTTDVSRRWVEWMVRYLK